MTLNAKWARLRAQAKSQEQIAMEIFHNPELPAEQY